MDEIEYLKSLGITTPPQVVRAILARFRAKGSKYAAYGGKSTLVSKRTAEKLWGLWKEGKLWQFESGLRPLDGIIGESPQGTPADAQVTEAESGLVVTLDRFYRKATGPDDKQTEWHLEVTLINQRNLPTSIVDTKLSVERPGGFSDELMHIPGDGYGQISLHAYLRPYETISGEIVFHDFMPLEAWTGARLHILDATGDWQSLKVDLPWHVEVRASEQFLILKRDYDDDTQIQGR